MKQAAIKIAELCTQGSLYAPAAGNYAGSAHGGTMPMCEETELDNVLQLFTQVTQRYNDTPDYKPTVRELSVISELTRLAADTESSFRLALQDAENEETLDREDIPESLLLCGYFTCMAFIYGIVVGWLIWGY